MPYGEYPTTRPRRLRRGPALRELVKETDLGSGDLIMPLFIHHGENVRHEIPSMPGHYQLSVDQLNAEIDEVKKLGLGGVILFGIPATKDAEGSSGEDQSGVIAEAVRHIKTIDPDLLVITDVCLCEYTDHGHCGVLDRDNYVDNDKTLVKIADQAITHAKAGADIVAPSSMTDGMVKAIRNGLDSAGYPELPILSYAVKYASAFYGPFRDAAQGAPEFGDRKHYQMDPRNRHEAIKEAALDVQEGADMLMVKPAGFFLDVIADVKSQFPHSPLAAYQVSGEYAMLQAAADKGWLSDKAIALEALYSIKRAGADLIISYFAKKAAEWLNQ